MTISYDAQRGCEKLTKYGGNKKMETNEIQETNVNLEENEDLRTRIGTKEKQNIQPAKVLIAEAKIEQVGANNTKKVVCTCTHPNATEHIKISGVKYEKKGQLLVSGLWLNKDEDNLIQKGSALANFLTFLGAETIENLNGKTCETITDDKGYLVFKGY